MDLYIYIYNLENFNMLILLAHVPSGYLSTLCSQREEQDALLY